MLTTMDGEDFPHPIKADIVKNTTHKGPARLTHLGKNKGIPINQKVLAKLRDIYKRLYTWKVENPKGRLEQKWVSWWAENPKGRSRQKLRIESV